MRGAYNALYIANVVFQAIFTLVMHIAIGLGLSWILVTKCGLPSWLYAFIIIISVMSGLFSMIKFILSAMKALDNLDKAHKEKRRNNEYK